MVFFKRRGAAPDLGKRLSSCGVGDIVKLYENGSPAEYLVVHKGLPDSTLYDASCDGVWLLRKAIYEKRQWNNSQNNYSASTIHSYLNSTFLSMFGEVEQSKIQQVKIPYQNGTGLNGSVAFSVNGLSTKVFLLSGYEVGWTTNNVVYFPIDGVCLDYFKGMTAKDNGRIAYLNGEPTQWWLRSPHTSNVTAPWIVTADGGSSGTGTTERYGVRPCIILPHATRLDPGTNTIIR